MLFECEPNCEYCANNRQKAEHRFWSKVKKTDNCWLWTGYVDPAGYGRFGFLNTTGYAHRFSLSLVEKLKDNLEIDHLCRNRNCIKPEHLEQVTHKINTYRSPIHIFVHPELNPHKGSKLTHCHKGHPFTQENTYIDPAKRRVCRMCKKNRREAWKQKNPNYMKEYNKKYNAKQKRLIILPQTA